MLPDYELVDLGINQPDYFQGFGVSGTKYNYSFVGVGCNPKNALEDCLEQIAEYVGCIDASDDCPVVDVDNLEHDIVCHYPEFINIELNNKITKQNDKNDSQYYIGIRF